MRDLALMQRVLRGKLASLPSPFVGPAAWESLWRQCPGAWDCLVERFVARAAADPAAFLAACDAVAAGPAGAPDVVQAVVAPPVPCDGGIAPAALPPAPAPAEVHAAGLGAGPAPARAAVEAELNCPECGRRFRSAGAVLCHRTHAHGRRRPAAAFVLSSVCPACGNDYRTRLRCLEHVERGSLRCRSAVLGGGLMPQPAAAVLAACEADRLLRRQARLQGVHERAGPPAIIHRIGGRGG